MVIYRIINLKQKNKNKNLTLELGCWVSVTLISAGSRSFSAAPRATEEEAAAEAVSWRGFRGGWSWRWVIFWREKEESF